MIVSGASDKPLTVDAPNTVQAKVGERIGLVDRAGSRPPVAAGELKKIDVPEAHSHRADFRSAHQAAGRAGLWPRRYREGAGALRRRVERIRARARLRGDLGRSRGYADGGGIRVSQAPAGAAEAAVCRHSRQSRFPRHDARGVSAQRLCLFVRAAQSEASKSAGSICCCWIPASPASRMANSMRRPCNGSTRRWRHRRTGRRCCSCTIRRSSTGIWHMDRQNLLNAGELAAVIERHPRVRLIATGHVHRATLTMFAGVADHDLPGAQSRRRSRSGASARALLQGRAAGLSSAQLVSRAKDSAASSPTRCRSASSTGRIRSSGRTGSCCSPSFLQRAQPVIGLRGFFQQPFFSLGAEELQRRLHAVML